MLKPENVIKHLTQAVEGHKAARKKAQSEQEKRESETQVEKTEKALNYPGQIDQTEKNQIGYILKDNPEAQALLDVLDQAMARKSIDNPVGYLRGIIKKWAAGEFTPVQQSQPKKTENKQHDSIKKIEAIQKCPYCDPSGKLCFGAPDPNRRIQPAQCDHDAEKIERHAKKHGFIINSAKMELRYPAKLLKPVRLTPEQEELKKVIQEKWIFGGFQHLNQKKAAQQAQTDLRSTIDKNHEP